MAARHFSCRQHDTAPAGTPGLPLHSGNAIICGHDAFFLGHTAFRHTPYIGDFEGELIMGERTEGASDRETLVGRETAGFT